jgi:hypothetical protein
MIENPQRTIDKEAEKAEMDKLLYGPSYAQGRTGHTGAASELVVCVDLIRRGYDVFRAVSPQCSCDLIAMKGINVFRVEVRTSQVLPNKKMRASRHGKYDILALVREWEVVYDPPIEL